MSNTRRIMARMERYLVCCSTPGQDPYTEGGGRGAQRGEGLGELRARLQVAQRRFCLVAADHPLVSAISENAERLQCASEIG